MEFSAERVIRSRFKVLVADDEHLIADSLAAILNQSGFETAVAYDGKEAVEKARMWRPHLLLSDVLMPLLNGIEAAIQICKVAVGKPIAERSPHAIHPSEGPYGQTGLRKVLVSKSRVRSA